MRAKWVKYKSLGGPRVKGTSVYNPPQPWGPWTKIMGVVARCEGAHDTVVMYDETGVTFGFMQWTFKSGRLQQLLESLKSIPVYDFEHENSDHTLFDEVCGAGGSALERYGFNILGGKFVEIGRGVLSVNNKAQQKRIVDVCMGRTRFKTFAQQKQAALELAEFFGEIGVEFGMAAAQIAFAKQEFKKQLEYKRPPLGGRSINGLLDGENPATWETPLAALFFNLWQNNPGAAYRLFQNARKVTDGPEAYFEQAWKLANRSTFGNWGWAKPANKSPRVVRIKAAIKEFYGVDLTYYK